MSVITLAIRRGWRRELGNLENRDGHMISALFERLQYNITSRKVARLPAVKVGRLAIRKHWTGNQEVIKDFSLEFVNKQAESMMQEIIKVAVSPDPRMANRAVLANCVLEVAQFQVLVIDPPPDEDASGLRGQLGISGELKARLIELSRADRGLQEFLHGFDGRMNEWDDVWNPVLLRYRMCYACAHVFSDLRVVFDDYNKASGKDWFGPFVAAMCGWQESQYRKVLGMASAFDGTPLKPLMLSMFMNCVSDGATYPDLEWNQRLLEVEKGDHKWRDNSWLAYEPQKDEK
jgi:hypothetical protein